WLCHVLGLQNPSKRSPSILLDLLYDEGRKNRGPGRISRSLQPTLQIRVLVTAGKMPFDERLHVAHQAIRQIGGIANDNRALDLRLRLGRDEGADTPHDLVGRVGNIISAEYPRAA